MCQNIPLEKQMKTKNPLQGKCRDTLISPGAQIAGVIIWVMDTQVLFSDYVNLKPIIWPFLYFCVLKPWSPKSVSEVCCSMTITRHGTFGATTIEETAASHPSLSPLLLSFLAWNAFSLGCAQQTISKFYQPAFWVGKKWIKSLMKPWSLLVSGDHQILSDLLCNKNSMERTILFVQLCTNILQG